MKYIHKIHHQSKHCDLFQVGIGGNNLTKLLICYFIIGNTYATNTSAITVTNVINITDTLSLPIRLEINDEINIEIKRSNETQIEKTNNDNSIESIEENTTSTSCCLVIDAPKCDTKQCVVRRRKMCWNICVGEIMVSEAPGFPKENFPRAFIPANWRSEKFSENLTIPLIPLNTVPSPYSSVPYYNNYYSNQRYVQSQPQLYWCPAPYYCFLYRMY